MTRYISRLRVSAFIATVCFSATVSAAFLEMPDTTEVPEYEEGSMLLDLEVPSVRERDPDPEAGPRLNVKEFRLQGMVEFPEFGITREELIAKVEALRFEIMQEDKQVEGGYTDEELAELADLIAQIEERTQEEHVGSVDVQQLVFLIREQRRKRGVTLGMIETVADTITRYYRERGFMLAKAYIPKQHVRDGVVTLTLLLGELGDVKVENNKRYADKTIKHIFKDDIGKPVTSNRMEEKLYLVNDLPGLAVRGFFQPGSQIGDTELIVNVVEEKPFNANIRIDNEGSEVTGEDRVYADVTFNKPWLIGGQLYLSTLATFNPDNSNYGAGRYSRNLWGPRWRGSIGYSENAFVIGLDVASETAEGETKGESKVTDMSVQYILRRSRAKNFSITTELRDIKTELKTLDSGGVDKTINLRLAFNFDVVDEKHQILHIGNVALNGSKFEPAAETFGDEDDRSSGRYLSYDYSMLAFVGLPFSEKKSRLVAKSAGQYSGEGLSNVNQFSMSGVHRTRAFAVNRFFADDAIYLGADLFLEGPGFDKFKVGGEKLHRILQPYLFVDYGYGVFYSPSSFEPKREGKFADVGLGLNINFRGKLRGGLSYAFPLQEEDGVDVGDSLQDPVEDSSGKFYFNLQYSF